MGLTTVQRDCAACDSFGLELALGSKLGPGLKTSGVRNALVRKGCLEAVTYDRSLTRDCANTPCTQTKTEYMKLMPLYVTVSLSPT